jgi:hypothetical protein
MLQKADFLLRSNFPVVLTDTTPPQHSLAPQAGDERDAVRFIHAPAEQGPATSAGRREPGGENDDSDAGGAEAEDRNRGQKHASGHTGRYRSLREEEAATKAAKERSAKKAEKLATKAKAAAAAGLGGGLEDVGDGDSSETASELSEDKGEDEQADWWVPRLMKGAVWVKVTALPPPPIPVPSFRCKGPHRFRVGGAGPSAGI